MLQTNIGTEANTVEHHSDVIKEMLEEAAQGVIIDNPDGDGSDLVYQEQFVESEEIVEEVLQDEECILYEEQVIEEDHQQIDDDIEMFTVQEEEHVIVEVPIISDTGIDEKSSSFPFGPTGGQSETSEDIQNEDGTNETGAVESSLLASLAGDNANSLPSVGGGEENDVKKEDFETKVALMESNCGKMESEDSLSEPAIAEDIGNAAEGSDATIVNTELVSEDELPLPTKPEINDAEEVSDDELPAPKRAELPADAEVISEDELLPTAASQTEKKSNSLSLGISGKSILIDSTCKESVGQKRKANDEDKIDCKYEKQRKVEELKKRSEEQYNPMSPTSESNDATPIAIVEKKNKIDISSVGKHFKGFITQFKLD